MSNELKAGGVAAKAPEASVVPILTSIRQAELDAFVSGMLPLDRKRSTYIIEKPPFTVYMPDGTSFEISNRDMFMPGYYDRDDVPAFLIALAMKKNIDNENFQLFRTVGGESSEEPLGLKDSVSSRDGIFCTLVDPSLPDQPTSMLGDRLDLIGANLRGANLKDANLMLADLRGADLEGAELRGGIYLSGARLTGEQVKLLFAQGHIDFISATLVEGADPIDFSGATPVEGAELSDAKLVGANFESAYLAEANFRGADLGGAKLRSVKLFNANLRRANLRRANLRGAELGGADLRGADLRGADFSGGICLRGAKLTGAQLTQAQVDLIAVGGTGYTGGLAGVIVTEIGAASILDDAALMDAGGGERTGPCSVM